ncbi:10991_t:CDS:2, partial [Ambispora gerdemannii]
RHKLSPYKQAYEQRARDRARREQQLEEEEERNIKNPVDQRALDRTMKVEHSTLDRVQKRLGGSEDLEQQKFEYV